MIGRLFFLLWLVPVVAQAQNIVLIDSIQTRLDNCTHDTDKVFLLNELSWEYKYTNSDTAIAISEMALNISTANNWVKHMAISESRLSTYTRLAGNYPLAIKHCEKSRDHYQKLDNPRGSAVVYMNLGIIHFMKGDHAKSIEEYLNC